MKKILLVLVGVLLLSGCNLQIIDTTWKYDVAYINVGSETIVCDISSWKDYENSDIIQVKCKDGRTFLGHASTIILQSN
ncbi:MAG: lipoprotein [Erysipelotrichaceae bacterium]